MKKMMIGILLVNSLITMANANELKINNILDNCQVSPRCTISKAISLNTSGKILNISGFV